MRYVYLLLIAIGVSLNCLTSVSTAADKNFPTRPIELIVNWGPGGGADLFARTISRIMESNLGVSIPAVNITGASGNAGLTRVARSKPDGYTTGTMTAITVSAWASGLGQLKVDDFAYIARPQLTPSMLFVLKDGPIDNYKEFLNEAKERPGEIRVATAGFGTTDDLTIRYIGEKGFNIVNIPFSKPAERFSAVLGGHVEALYEEPGDMLQYLESKLLVPIVIFARERHPRFPEVPAASEFGHEVSFWNWRALVAPAQIPEEQLIRLHKAVIAATETKTWRTFCGKTFSCNDSGRPEEVKAFVKEQYQEIRQSMIDYGLLSDKAKEE